MYKVAVPFATVKDIPKALQAAMPLAVQEFFLKAYNLFAAEGCFLEVDAFWGAYDAMYLRGFYRNYDGSWVDSIRKDGAVTPVQKTVDKFVQWKVDINFQKAETAEDKRLVFGWLSVANNAEGQPIVDHKGDIIPLEELESAAYQYVLYSRAAGVMHNGVLVGSVVESMVFTPEKQAALGVKVQQGWWIGFRITDDDVWAGIKAGAYKMFSIGGYAVRDSGTTATPVEAPVEADPAVTATDPESAPPPVKPEEEAVVPA